jgi:hypothetical protein
MTLTHYLNANYLPVQPMMYMYSLVSFKSILFIESNLLI